MSVRLMVLGLLDRGPRHGYELRKLATENRTEVWAGVLPGSIYHALRQLEKEGLVRQSGTENQGKRVREMFTITPAGRRALVSLMREAWREPVRSVPTALYGALAFRDALPRAEERLAVAAQIADLEREVGMWERARPLKGPMSKAQEAAYDNGLDHLRADLKLLRRLRELR